MINVKDLTKSQRMALEAMKHFSCKHISCEDCPLNTSHGCGTNIAKKILKQYEKGE